MLIISTNFDLLFMLQVFFSLTGTFFQIPTDVSVFKFTKRSQQDDTDDFTVFRSRVLF